MKLLITHETHAKQVGGIFYNPNGVIDYNALCNYRYHIKDVCLIVRSTPAAAVGEGWLPINGPGIEVRPIPEPFSIAQVVFFMPRIISSILKTIRYCDRYMVRLPGPTGSIVAAVLFLMRKCYAVEFVGHASESLEETRGGSNRIKLCGAILDNFTKFLVKHAMCVAYRSNYLKKLYPNKKHKHEWVFSGAQIDKDVIGHPRNPDFFNSETFNIVFVGRLMREKGIDYLIEAVKDLKSRTSQTVQLHIIGDGQYLRSLINCAKTLNIEESVIFYGRIVRGPELFAKLDKAHLFVLPSLSEGMPRALIEAMARGLPAIGSRKGGIPELLPQDFLFDPGSSKAIMLLMLKIINDNNLLSKMSHENFEASKMHWVDGLRKSKDGFWQEVEELCR